MSIYDFTVKLPNGDDKSFMDFRGNVLLIVNTASHCGLAPQFEGLQQLYTKYGGKGFVILGFPCDQFMNQEFDNIDQTLEFCQMNYGVTFPMFAKIDVNGKNEHPLYTYLKKQKGGLLTKDIKWNFTKFLVDRNGNVVERFAPTTKPKELEQFIEKYLG